MPEQEETISPIIVDGPLKGKDFPILRGWLADRAFEVISSEGERVRYYLHKFGFHYGGTEYILWMAMSEPEQLSAEVLADLILNDAAKAAHCE